MSNSAAPSERRADLERLAARLAEMDGVADAWVMNSYRDHRMLVLEVPSDQRVPNPVQKRLAANGLVGVNRVYDIDEGSPSFAGTLGDVDRHRFADCEDGPAAAYYRRAREK